MPTSNPRVNVVLDPKLYKDLKEMAEGDGISLSLKARELLMEAMELHEDECWAKAAGERLRTFDRKKALTLGELKKRLKKSA
jgi:hypothetical protein